MIPILTLNLPIMLLSLLIMLPVAYVPMEHLLPSYDAPSSSSSYGAPKPKPSYNSPVYNAPKPSYNPAGKKFS